MSAVIKGRVCLLGDGINTDLHCSAKYLPGKNAEYIAQRAFEQLSPGFSSRLRKGDVIVAGRNFGIHSSCEQAVHVMHIMGVAAVLSPGFGRLFFRNAINNGLPAVECDITGIVEGDEITVDLESGRVSVAARGIAREVPPLRHEVSAILSAGGLIPFLQAHPDWKLPGN
jgi:3-isopropylmalate dehydratase small subunit